MSEYERCPGTEVAMIPPDEANKVNQTKACAVCGARFYVDREGRIPSHSRAVVNPPEEQRP